MINHLRALQTETPLGPPVTPPFEKSSYDEKELKMRRDFIRMVEYYGLTFAVYPLEFTLLEGDRKNVELVCRPGIYNIDSREKVTVSLCPDSTHSRCIIAFEVTLGPFSHALVGWQDQNKYRTLLNCGDNTITYPSGTVAGTVREVAVEEGAVLRFESSENKWFVNGRLVAFCHKSASNVIQMLALAIPSVVCIELKGKCSIAVELSH